MLLRFQKKTILFILYYVEIHLKQTTCFPHLVAYLCHLPSSHPDYLFQLILALSTNFILFACIISLTIFSHSCLPINCLSVILTYVPVHTSTKFACLSGYALPTSFITCLPTCVWQSSCLLICVCPLACSGCLFSVNFPVTVLLALLHFCLPICFSTCLPVLLLFYFVSFLVYLE